MKKLEEYSMKINTKKESRLITNLREKIKQEIIGQDRAVRRLLRAVASYYSGLKDPRRPIGGFIFAGPTGVGKTFTGKVFARHFLGGSDKYRDYLTRIDGSTLTLQHDVSKLSGAPPGFVGYGDSNLLAQENIDVYDFDVRVGNDDGNFARQLKDWQKLKNSPRPIFPGPKQETVQAEIELIYKMNKPYRSVILFDEIEKSHKDIWNILLQIMEEGKIQMGKSDEETNFADSMIILTTNIGQRSIQGMIGGRERIGFGTNQNTDTKKLDEDIYRITKEQVKKEFPPELFKRLDLIVFRPLKEEDFTKILDNFLLEEQERLNERLSSSSRLSIDISYTSEARKFLLKKGVDIHYGVRTLRATIEKYVRIPIANGIASEEIMPGDKILIDGNKEELIFIRKPRKKGPKNIKYRSLKHMIENESKKLRLLPAKQKQEH